MPRPSHHSTAAVLRRALEPERVPARRQEPERVLAQAQQRLAERWARQRAGARPVREQEKRLAALPMALRVACPEPARVERPAQRDTRS